MPHSLTHRRAMDNSADPNVSSRKIRKPLMERKRRARINHCLDELQHILTENELASKGSKLEKADILEMTVQYLRRVKQNDCSREIDENLDNAMLERYLLGFEKCAEEMEKLLKETSGLDPHLRQKILWHLNNSLERVRTQQSRQGTTPARGGWTIPGSCSVFFRQPNDLRILPSKLLNGDVLLLLSSSDAVKCEDSLNKNRVWRPWW